MAVLFLLTLALIPLMILTYYKSLICKSFLPKPPKNLTLKSLFATILELIMINLIGSFLIQLTRNDTPVPFILGIVYCLALIVNSLFLCSKRVRPNKKSEEIFAIIFASLTAPVMVIGLVALMMMIRPC